jgi:hypothetical protein
MANDLTSGFDLVAQLSESVCESILQMAYFADLPGGVPDYVSAQGEIDPKDLVEVYFDPPRLEFVKIGDLPAAVKVTFSFTARLFPENVEIHGGIDVLMAVGTTTQPDGTTAIVVDVVPNVPGQFDTYGSSPQERALIESRVKGLLVPTLAGRLKARPISPPLSREVGFFTFRAFMFPANPGRLPEPPVRLLAIFINRQNAPAPAPTSVGPWVTNTRFTAPSSRGGVAIAISGRVVQPLIDPNLAKQGLPGPAPTDDSLIINSVAMTLDDGFIAITGDATKQIDFLPDPNVDFEVRVGLWVKDGEPTTQVLHVDSDLPWWLNGVQVLVPVFGTMFVNTVGDVVSQLIRSAVGGVSQGAVSDIAAFGTDLPNAGGLVKVTNTGRVSIRPDGLILPGYAETTFTPRAIKIPEYIYGNDETKEFHKKECPYFRVMKRTKQVMFINPLHALSRLQRLRPVPSRLQRRTPRQGLLPDPGLRLRRCHRGPAHLTAHDRRPPR